MKNKERRSDNRLVDNGPRDTTTEDFLLTLLSPESNQPTIDMRETVTDLLTNVSNLIQQVAVLLQASDEEKGSPILLQQKTVSGDQLPKGPRIDYKGLDIPYTKSNEGGLIDPKTKETIYGPTFLMWFLGSSTECGEYDILQLSKLKVEEWDPKTKKWKKRSPDTHDWDVDGETSTKDPTNKTVVKASGKIIKAFPEAKHYTDTPGTPANPWERPDMQGRKFRYTHDFETYMVCLKPEYKILGFYSWGYIMEATIGKDKKSTSSSYPNDKKNPSKPKWHDGKKGGHLKQGLKKWNPKQADKWSKG